MLKFNKEKPLIIGCVHVLPLPGAAGYSGNISKIIDISANEANIYSDCGFDAIILENMHDTPYLKGFVYPETIAAMTAVAVTVKDLLPEMPVGIQILSAANREALAVAISAKLDFIRAEGYTFAHVADEGIIQSSAAELIRLRDYLKATNIKIIADIKKKHSAHSITADVSIEETAEAADFMCADGIVITGTATGKEPDIKDLKSVKATTHLPVLLGSGINPENVKKFSGLADGIIIGSYCKADGLWKNTVCPERCNNFIKAVKNS
ncbi:MAG: BtpA/SgcQ family protein [Cyanobacteriota bacterium]